MPDGMKTPTPAGADAATAAGQPALLPAPAPGASGRSTAQTLPGRRRAAILMMALREDLSRELLQDLPDDIIEVLAGEIASLQHVDAAVTTSVLEEFEAMLKTDQQTVQGGLASATRLLAGALGQARADSVLGQVQRTKEANASNLAMLQRADPVQLSKSLENEHPQTVAMVLAHLDPQRGSQVLAALGEEQRVAAVQRLAEMRHFSPEVAQKVARILHQQLQTMGDTRKHSYSGYKAVADLLNGLEAEASKKILDRVELGSPETAISVRNLMFTFEDLVSVPSASVRELVAGVDRRQLALAMKGTKDELRAHIFKAMSSRAAELLREEIELMGPVRSREVMQAQQTILAAARRMEAAGEIVLKLEQGDSLMV
jgi:flagellar motor switch protein FliG